MSAKPFYEDFLARHFPFVAAKRAAARTAAEMFSTFRGADRGRTGAGWERNDLSPRGGRYSDRLEQQSMSDRAVAVYANNPIGRSLLNTETDNVVAQGFTLRVQTDSADFNKEAEDGWYEWLDEADLAQLRTGGQLQQMGWKMPRLQGDGGWLLTSDRFNNSRLQFVPGRQICNRPGKPDSPTQIGGITVDAGLAPQAFTIQTVDQFGVVDYQDVSAADFVYIAHTDDPLGVRGISCYAQIFNALDQLDGYIDAVTTASRMAAVFGLIFKSDNAAQQFSAIQQFLPNSQGGQQKAVTLDNGLLKYIGSKDDVVQVNPQQPMGNTPQFIQALFRVICLAFDMPLEIGAKDLSTVNFAGGRLGLLKFNRRCVSNQALAIRPWDRIYGWWLSRELKLGRFKSRPPQYGVPGQASVWQAHEFHGQVLETNSALEDAQVDFLEYSIGIQSKQRMAAKRSRDFTQIQEEIRTGLKDSPQPEVFSTYTRDRTTTSGGSPTDVAPTNPDESSDETATTAKEKLIDAA